MKQQIGNFLGKLTLILLDVKIKFDTLTLLKCKEFFLIKHYQLFIRAQCFHLTNLNRLKLNLHNLLSQVLWKNIILTQYNRMTKKKHQETLFF